MIFVVYWGTTNNISSAERKRAKVLLTGRGKVSEVTKPYKDPARNQKRTCFKEFKRFLEYFKLFQFLMKALQDLKMFLLVQRKSSIALPWNYIK